MLEPASFYPNDSQVRHYRKGATGDDEATYCHLDRAGLLMGNVHLEIHRVWLSQGAEVDGICLRIDGMMHKFEDRV